MNRLDRLVRPWAGQALRHIPADSQYDVLDLRYAARCRSGHWSEEGESTLYLAQDETVILSEARRRFPARLSPHVRDRATYKLNITLDRVLDLRDPAVLGALGLADDAPTCFLDETRARATARYVRALTSAQAILVPVLGMLHDPDRWALVCFLDKLPAANGFVRRVEPEGRLSLSGALVLARKAATWLELAAAGAALVFAAFATQDSTAFWARALIAALGVACVGDAAVGASGEVCRTLRRHQRHEHREREASGGAAS